ncbi:centrosomal protein of 135 kDa-like isoform X1 [Octopus sinensis]|uniref:Centrosomal protein of 135 kDa-like isoform X1 n=2 Tax=Octopus sinensis TaxID=2607531 RepID=A0A6P7T1E2_9MOLL|nr:centrosomal protein of 135 kDa-like isoform X1 [Octopus sinensis]
MSSKETMNTSEKLKNLRRRLEQLGYKDSLGIESLPLVERLFVDLLKTIEDLRKIKVEHSRKSDAEDPTIVDSYKNDNAKLVKENNALNLKLLKATEENNTAMKDLKSSLRKSEHTLADIKFLNNQYLHKIKLLEKESKEKSDRIQQLQEKNFHAVVQTPGGKKKNIPFRRQRMVVDCLIPPAEPDLPSPPPVPDPYIADMLETADKRIAENEEQVTELKDNKELLESKLEAFKEQVSARDDEIDRLNKMLSGGRPSDTLALEVKNRANEKMISHLNIQVDILQEQNRELQHRLHESTEKRDDVQDEMFKLNKKNADLQLQMRNIDRKAKLLQNDKEYVVKAADSEINVAKKELLKSRQQLEDLDRCISQLKSENEQLQTELEDAETQNSNKTTSLKKLEMLLDKVQEEKRRMIHKVNKLTANEKELILENEQLKHRGTITKKGKVPARVESLIKTLEEDRNYYRDQATSLQKTIQSDPSGSSNRKTRLPRSRSASPNKEMISLPDKLDKKTISHYERICQLLEQERDYFKSEYEQLKAIRRSTSPKRPQSNKNQNYNDEELQKAREERDKMKDMLEKFERHMNEVRANVKVLTKERDNLKDMYDGAKEELQKLRREILRSPKSPRTSLAAQAVLRQVENERDNASADLQRIMTERDSLQERLRLSTDSSLTERAHLEQKVEDLSCQLSLSEVERDELQLRVNNLKDDVHSLEERIKNQAVQYQDSHEELSKQRMTATQMRLLAEEAERSLSEIQRRLNHREEDIHNQTHKISNLEEQLQEYEKVSHQSRNEINQLQSTINAMDREKDSLQMTVDEKTERLAVFREELLAKDRTISDFKVQISQLESQLEHVNSSLSLKEREMKSIKRQFDKMSDEFNETSRNKDAVLRENKRLQEDLAVMTSENQVINKDLQNCLEEKDSLKKQIQSYMMEVQRVGDLLSSKEQERSDMLEQYRTLSAEAEQYQNTNHQLETEGSNLRLEVISKESEIRMLKEKLERMDIEIHEHLGAQQAYELQVSNLNRTLSKLEENLQQYDDEKQNLTQDINAVRDLCCRLEASKESLQRQVTAVSVEKEQLHSQILDMKQEADTLREQLSTERKSVKNLEELLQNNREKEFHSQLEFQERNAELKQLKDRLTLNESKLQSQSRDIASLRTRNVELEGDIERFRRQLTSEKFERERAVQELRRHGISPPITGDYSSISRSTSPSKFSKANNLSSRLTPPVSSVNEKTAVLMKGTKSL